MLVGSSSDFVAFAVAPLPPQIVMARPGSQFLVPVGRPVNVDGMLGP